ncbi:MAG: YkgJ family cysteine cluster protein [Chitinispirillaceae bacterium]|nr:YkgJ family cysteine cluster protein [Chitinispirillaceae bacterium]
MARIIGHLTALEQATCSSPLDTPFLDHWLAFLGEVDSFQQCVITHSEYTVTCSRGCADCCYHWVEDVNSFEAEIISATLKKQFPDRIEAILQTCRTDIAELERLDSLVQERLQGQNLQSPEADPDPDDLLLHVYYRMRRPCPLLHGDGSCMVYEVRPLTCRMYLSFSDPIRCDPDYIDPETTSTCMLDLSERANAVLDRLHFTYLRHEGDTGLRSLLAKYLA